MKIVNRKNEEIEACLKFKYKNVWISVSTIAQPSDVLIYDKDHKDLYQTHTIPMAMKWIDKNIDPEILTTKIWVSKHGSFACYEEQDALIYLINLRKDKAAYRKKHGGKPPTKITLSKDNNRYYFTFGCSSCCIRKITIK
jgi:hypothetical protein